MTGFEPEASGLESSNWATTNAQNVFTLPNESLPE